MLPPPRHVLFLILAIVLIGMSYVGGLLNGTGPGVNKVPAGATALKIDRSPGRLARGSGLTVDVAGEVTRPGVYVVPPGSRVLDALTRAGGPTQKADSQQINRAAPVVDGQHIVVLAAPPTNVGAGTMSTSSAPTAPSSAGLVSINSGTAEALEQLPGVGPATALAIIDDRSANGPFGSVADLDRVSGIGPATIAQLESAVTL